MELGSDEFRKISRACCFLLTQAPIQGNFFEGAYDYFQYANSFNPSLDEVLRDLELFSAQPSSLAKGKECAAKVCAKYLKSIL